MRNVPCFFMLCTDRTENECLKKGLFGDKEWRLPHLKSIKKGDIGFLLNVSQNQLLGIFEAEEPPQLNIDPQAWGGEFPAQVKVKLIGELQRVNNASDELGKILELREIKKELYSYKVPKQNTYGPEITEKVLSLFNIPDTLIKEQPRPAEVGIVPTEYTLEDVAGLEDVKNFIYQRIIAPFEDEETAYSLKLKIGGGMLLYGPPGTGKTLIAMAIAKSIQAKFIEISPSVIIGYPGEAEKRLENIFTALDKEPRAVVFLDEAEWILGKREEQTSSVMQRITPLLLTQLSRIFKEKTRPIVIIAATNKPEMIDPAFLRPGRFKSFYIDLPDKDAREKIIKLQLRGRDNNLTDDDITEIAEKLDGYSGADIENIIEEGAFVAFSRRKEGKASITKDDIEEAIRRTPKSVTPDEVEKFKKWAQERGLKN